MAYFGCQRIAEQCENPLEWDACDLDVEALAMWIHDETRDISAFTHSQGRSFIPAAIRHSKDPEPLPPLVGLSGSGVPVPPAS